MPPSVTTNGKPIKNRLRSAARIALPAGVTPQLSGQAVATTSWEGGHCTPPGVPSRQWHSWASAQLGKGAERECTHLDEHGGGWMGTGGQWCISG